MTSLTWLNAFQCHKGICKRLHFHRPLAGGSRCARLSLWRGCDWSGRCRDGWSHSSLTSHSRCGLLVFHGTARKKVHIYTTRNLGPANGLLPNHHSRFEPQWQWEGLQQPLSCLQQTDTYLAWGVVVLANVSFIRDSPSLSISLSVGACVLFPEMIRFSQLESGIQFCDQTLQTVHNCM